MELELRLAPEGGSHTGEAGPTLSQPDQRSSLPRPQVNTPHCQESWKSFWLWSKRHLGTWPSRTWQKKLEPPLCQLCLAKIPTSHPHTAEIPSCVHLKAFRKHKVDSRRVIISVSPP
ncbi:hypothetical protein H920_00098 [Fukomys damarensis]|uniref:Uncharacterized protein n=1 Tax=Fukomys damarensis TaxID=885580 RepID=A0A091E243_FUKDA|nr:hypothetical protein H920_00098 [Fukomys damarensis]